MAIIAEYQQRLVGCGAIAGNVLKCIAIDPSLQGEGLSLKLLTELLTLAYELGRSELFLFTKTLQCRVIFRRRLLADSPGGRPRRANGK
ncbi:[citrate (pro-3S)-lyase] ligase [Klebsiella pneumoniae]|nr:[citrate (pro-3S)-lyase] ligase [Klebsiella pneumoniae]